MSKDTTIIIKGWLRLRGGWDSEDDLMISPIISGCFDDEPIAETLEELITGKRVTVSYYISDTELAESVLSELVAMSTMGIASVEYCAHYSEITGYLWTDEKLNIGGHDLLDELKTFVGSYLHMNITVHNN